jgi:hypothetical protein
MGLKASYCGVTTLDGGNFLTGVSVRPIISVAAHHRALKTGRFLLIMRSSESRGVKRVEGGGRGTAGVDNNRNLRAEREQSIFKDLSEAGSQLLVDVAIAIAIASRLGGVADVSGQFVPLAFSTWTSVGDGDSASRSLW